VNEVIQAAAELQGFCELQRWRFCFIGGLALQRWGEPRETVDVDLTLMTGFGHEEAFIDTLLSQYRARIGDAKNFAIQNRVLLLCNAAGVGLDVALGALAFEESVIARSSEFIFPPDTPIRTCSAEDLVVMKSFASRPKDWFDIEGILLRQQRVLDWNYIQAQLLPLITAKEAPEIWSELQRRRRDIEG
jgi:Nucleotidyl transferase AbiEii toxin, Type IV TA system